MRAKVMITHIVQKITAWKLARNVKLDIKDITRSITQCHHIQYELQNPWTCCMHVCVVDELLVWNQTLTLTRHERVFLTKSGMWEFTVVSYNILKERWKAFGIASLCMLNSSVISCCRSVSLFDLVTAHRILHRDWSSYQLVGQQCIDLIISRGLVKL